MKMFFNIPNLILITILSYLHWFPSVVSKGIKIISKCTVTAFNVLWLYFTPKTSLFINILHYMF
jgi:hypothetical protein